MRFAPMFAKKEKLLSEASFKGYFGHVTFYLCNKVLLYNIRGTKVNF